MITREYSSHYILQNIPIFKHLRESEIQSLFKVAEVRLISKNQRIDIKKLHSLGVIIDGMFELGQSPRTEISYLAPGSFFGDIPFTYQGYAGSIKAVRNSSILLMDPDEINRVLLTSYKGLRGYIRNLKKNGFEIIDTGKDFLKYKSKVITVFSSYHKSGNSIFTVLLGLRLSDKEKTIILDASYNGSSIFNIFEIELPPALSQKFEGKASADKLINDRIVEINDNLSLLNVSSGSRVRINTDILSPVISILSRRFKYIIVDHSDYEKDYTSTLLGLSDIILPVVKSIKEKKALYPILDSLLKEGQRVYYILNRFYAKDMGSFEGGYIFEDLKIRKRDCKISHIQKQITNGIGRSFDELAEIIKIEKTALVAETNLIDSALLSGFFSILFEKDIKLDFIYTSSWSYLIAALFILSRDRGEFERNFLHIFSEERINSFLEITFPEEYIYKNKIFHYACDLAGDNRLEHYNIIPMARLCDQESLESRIFSTGYMFEIFSASFLLNFFQPQRIANAYYHSGFPFNRVKPEDLLRIDVDEIRSISINNKQILNFGAKRMLKFHKRFIHGLQMDYASMPVGKTDKDIIIDVNINKYNAKEILKISKEICENIKF